MRERKKGIPYYIDRVRRSVAIQVREKDIDGVIGKERERKAATTSNISRSRALEQRSS